MPELMRQLRAEEARDPVENAFYALLALPAQGRTALVRRWDEFHKDRGPYPRLSIAEPEAGSDK